MQKTKDTFISTGFKNWKKGRERFAYKAQSECHKIAVTTQIYETRSVDVQLSNVQASQKEEAHTCLLKIVCAVQFLARQGLALRGHDDSEGNFAQLLKYKSDLRKWLSSRIYYTCPQVQNEILNLLSHSIIREIADNIRSLWQLQFSVIMDGTQDVSGKEQEAVCVRYVDHDLIIHEEFVGMYEVSVTTGENLAKVIMDVLLRLNLSITGLRGQAYDGAANMAGIYSGAQAIIKKHQPLAPYVHCGAHCVNLITQHACTASSVVRDSLQWAHELGVLFGQSLKMKSIFQDIKKGDSGPAQSIRPLCPTRWTVRTGAIRSLLNQYQPVLLALEEMASGKSDSASRANGLLERWQKGNVVLGLLLALEVTEELECLNKALQSRTQAVNGMLAAVTCVKESIAEKRTPDKFQSLYNKASQMCEKLNLSPIEMPRVRNPPKRLAGKAAAHVPPSSVDYFRTEFFKVLDTVSMQFTERFENEGLLMIRKLEKVLLTGVTDDDVLLQYPEVYRPSLQVQLAMFKSKYDFQSSSEAATILQGMLPEVSRNTCAVASYCACLLR